MKKAGILLIALVIIFGITYIGSYNGLVKMEEDVSSKWAQIDNNLQRRADLIPNLVNTVKGYASHEKEVFGAVAEARSKLGGAATVTEKAQANSELSNAIGRLLMIQENYPELKADKTFQSLMDELAGTENRLSVARKDYNDSVQKFNARIKGFPGNIYAAISGFEKKDYFTIDDSAKATPKVDLP